MADCHADSAAECTYCVVDVCFVECQSRCWDSLSGNCESELSAGMYFIFEASGLLSLANKLDPEEPEEG